MPYTARNVTPGGALPEDFRKKHNLSKSAHWASDQRLPGSTSSSRRPMSSVSSGGSSYGNLFRNTSMPKDFHSFAEKAIEIAGQAGERKRQFRTQQAGNLARSRMAEVNRQQKGKTKRQAMIEAGKAAGRDTSGGGIRGAGAKSTGTMPKSTRLKSFDYANKAMGEMYPDRINPVTKEPFTPEAWTERINELADQREAYAGVQQPEEEPTGLQGRGAVYMPSTGQRWDVGADGNIARSLMGQLEQQGVGGDITRSLTEQPYRQGGGMPMAPETVVPAETVSLSALEKWRKKYPRRAKTRIGGEDPITTITRSLAKPIDRSRLGKPVDYMNIFGSQQRF